MRVYPIATHQIGDDIFAEIVTGFRLIGVALKLLVKKCGVEDINSHTRQRARRVAGNVCGIAWLFGKFDYTLFVVNRHHAECAGIGDRHVQACNRHIRLQLHMLRDHLAVVHFVNMVAGKNQNIFRRMVTDDVEILEYGVRRALIPTFLQALLSGHQIDAFFKLPRQETPSALQVLQQAVGFILRRHADAANTGVNAIGKWEIDNAKLAAEWHRRLGAPIGERPEPAPAATGQNKREGVFRQATDIAAGGLFELSLRTIVHRCSTILGWVSRVMLTFFLHLRIIATLIILKLPFDHHRFHRFR